MPSQREQAELEVINYLLVLVLGFAFGFGLKGYVTECTCPKEGDLSRVQELHIERRIDKLLHAYRKLESRVTKNCIFRLTGKPLDFHSEKRGP